MAAIDSGGGKRGRFSLGEWSEGRLWAVILLLPSVLVIAVVILYPTIDGILLSFRQMRLTRPIRFQDRGG
ncbi:MAG: hypothetical protein AAFW98_12355 [Pseudomonadota bacterium]